MILADFTINNNEQIRLYFEGSNEYIPSSELVYLHEHPLIQNSFLHELEYLIDKSTECLVTRNVKGAVVEKFIEATIRFGILLPDVNKDNASDILIELRKIYKLCNGLLKDFNFK